MRLVTFLKTVAREMLDLEYGSVDDKPREYMKVQSGTQRKSGSCYNVQASQNSTIGNSSDPKRQAQARRCFLCNNDHLMTTCKVFLEMSPQKRLDAVREKRLCFNCLQFRNHTAKMCKFAARYGANNCTCKHSKLLHAALSAARDKVSYSQSSDTVERRQDREEAQVKQVKGDSFACGGSAVKMVSLPIVTIYVKGIGQDEYIQTNALLDSGSNRTFCSKELIEQLGVKGKQTTLSLQTLNEGKDTAANEVSLEAIGTIGKRRKRQVIQLPKVYALSDFPALKGSVALSTDVRTFSHLNDICISNSAELDVAIIIGQDVPQALVPLEVRRGKEGEPYAVRTALGWTVNGPLDTVATYTDARCNYVHVEAGSDLGLEAQVERFWNIDTGHVLAGSRPQMSVDDKKVIKVWESSLKHSDGHYELDIPFKSEPTQLPDNKPLALKRLQYLSRRFGKDPELHRRYQSEIQTLLDKGYAEVVPEREVDGVPGRTWYLPHHAVTNPNKPDKLRVVFDCAAEYLGNSLNKCVLQGPDLSNNLLGVLLRFREGRIAIMSDIEAMFYQVNVSPSHRDALRFLWWKDGDVSRDPGIYRMKVHPFGGVWSPSCTSFALRQTAEQNSDMFDPETVQTVLRDFYVDDCLKSVDSESKAVKLVGELSQLTSLGGFHLTKWISNNRKVLQSVPVNDRAKEIKTLDLDRGTLPIERALGLSWDTNNDSVGIKTNPKNVAHTKRGLLSVTSSIYDPLGLVCPFVLQAKKLFQSECKLIKGWDEELHVDNKNRWLRWLRELPELEKVTVDRCVLPESFGACTTMEIHHFCDASQEAYGVVSYLRAVNDRGRVHCSFLLGKSRLAPIKQMTIPRLELMAAVMAVRVSSTLEQELQLKIDRNVFWSDSMIVLQYVKSKTRRFHTFVANRVAIIHDGSYPEQWRYVDTKSNPADDASRGLSAPELVQKGRWLQGPEFLWGDELEWPKPPDDLPDIQDDDREVKQSIQSCVAVTEHSENPVDRLLSYHSTWHRLRKAVAWLLKFKKWLRDRAMTKMSLDAADTMEAERAIVQYLQGKCYGHELSDLRSQRVVSRKSHIHDLEPCLLDDGIIRVGGRLQEAPIQDSAKHPTILPRDHHVTELIVRHTHEWQHKT
ncbi:PREDICTED: uncharacterized protein LOC106816368 [Priapulus caudatus]|uniref:Uncharacterized protein LOC106816368 n=1 Tax=Priapulus caudatus TaxID=37621 RepID=A0ABM1EW78_PRICU|nr:PREDICTED: uncharacterized protein LOC106816368 [Priapulus caudatus]